MSGELKIISDKDLDSSEYSKPPAWLIKDIIPEGSCCVLAGKRASYKSFLALYIAYCLASGKPFLSTFNSTKTRVLYIDEENGPAILGQRRATIKKGLGLSGYFDVDFLSFAAVDLEREVNALKDYFEIRGVPGLIIVDSLRRVIGVAEDDAGQISEFFTKVIRPISTEYGCAWLFIHHNRKGAPGGRQPLDELDEVRGSSDLVNYADIVLAANRLSGDAGTLIFKQLKSRYSEELGPKLCKFEWDESGALRLTLLGDAEENLYLDEACAKVILEWMGENQLHEFHTKEVKDALRARKYASRTAERALTLLVSRHQLIKPKKGVYQPNPALSAKPLGAFSAEEVDV